jgi:hypothetical protein
MDIEKQLWNIIKQGIVNTDHEKRMKLNEIISRIYQ